MSDELVVPRGWRKLSRPCYDKPRRCPGWAGGGWKFAKVRHCRDGGITFGMTRDKLNALSRAYDTDPAAARELDRYPRRLALGRCADCDVVVLPFWMRKLSPLWLRRELWRGFANWSWWRRADLTDWRTSRQEARK